VNRSQKGKGKRPGREEKGQRVRQGGEKKKSSNARKKKGRRKLLPVPSKKGGRSKV